MVGKLHVKKIRTQESPPWSSGYSPRPLVPPHPSTPLIHHWALGCHCTPTRTHPRQLWMHVRVHREVGYSTHVGASVHKQSSPCKNQPKKKAISAVSKAPASVLPPPEKVTANDPI